MTNKEILTRYYASHDVLLYTSENILCADARDDYRMDELLVAAIHAARGCFYDYYYGVDSCPLISGLDDYHIIFQDYQDTLNQTEVLQRAVVVVDKAAHTAHTPYLLVMNFGVEKLSYALAKGLARFLERVHSLSYVYVIVVGCVVSNLYKRASAYITIDERNTWLYTKDSSQQLSVLRDTITFMEAEAIVERALYAAAYAMADAPPYFEIPGERLQVLIDSLKDCRLHLQKEVEI